MSHRATGLLQSSTLLVLCLASMGNDAWSQTAPAQKTGWHQVGGTSVVEGLAGPAGGPVSQVWFSASGDRLLARTESGRVFETTNAQASTVVWNLNTTDTPPRARTSAPDALTPEAGAQVETAGGRMYAAGRSNVFISDDDGRTWASVTSSNGQSILGEDFTSLAVSPANPQEIVVANAFGVWRSADGGISWRSLNEGFPNLPVRKLAGRRMILLASGAKAELTAGDWTSAPDRDPEIALRARFSATANSEITAAAQTSTVSYAGTADGRLLASRNNNGATWSDVRLPSATGPVNRIWVDATQPELALASAGGHLLRTLNGGGFWDDVSGSLPDPSINGIAADRQTDHVWIATGRGVFEAHVPLNSAALVSPDWRSANPGLPTAAAWDVRLNNDNTVEVALDGYGVYETDQAQRGGVHVANGADLSDRAAAPGSLISVIGAKVTSGRSGNIAWPVLAVSPDGSQLQVPFETSTGALTVAIEASGNSFTVPVRVKDAAPAIFVDGDGSPLVLDSASGLVLDPKSPVHPGSLVQIMATGLGRVNPDWPTGIPAPSDAPPTVRGSVTAFLDGGPLEVTRATLAPGYVGYYVVELKIPTTITAGVRELRLVMNGEQSNAVKMYLDSGITEGQ
jgi:uncharacterized protein (TIGR03437 family)